MAYITSERTSVRNLHYSKVSVAITAGNVDFSDILEGSGNRQLNHYWIKDRYPGHAELLTSIYEVINRGNYDHSDIQSDYFDVGFYVDMEIGQWDKPYKLEVK